MSAHNPFREKATRARAVAERYNTINAHDAAMADSFPLGAGYGRRGATKRLESTISRATKAIQARTHAAYLEAQADAFDAGQINGHGRREDPAARIRRNKASMARDSRAARIAAAKEERDSKPRHEVTPEVWATAAGYLGGSGRELVMSDQREYISRFHSAKKPH